MIALGFTALAAALSILSGICSIAGLRDFAPGATAIVTALGIILEISKLALTAWLHFAWANLPRPMRIIGCSLVTGIMLLSMLGIYGHLRHAHDIQTAGHSVAQARADMLDSRIADHRTRLAEARTELATLEEGYQALTAAGRVSLARVARQTDRTETEALRQRLDTEESALADLQAERFTVQQSLSAGAADLGPARALAALLGWGEDAATNFFIAMIMLPFDPLAVFFACAAAASRQPLAATSTSAQLSKQASQSQSYWLRLLGNRCRQVAFRPKAAAALIRSGPSLPP